MEDEPGVRRLFEAVLAEDGYHVHSVAAGRHALRLVRDVSFDLVIVDMSLPDLDGPDVIREILAEFPYIRVVAVSGAMEGHMRALAYRAGALSVFQKPITPSNLRKAIYVALDSSGSWLGNAAD